MLMCLCMRWSNKLTFPKAALKMNNVGLFDQYPQLQNIFFNIILNSHCL